MQNFECYTVIEENGKEKQNFVDLQIDEQAPLARYPFCLMLEIDTSSIESAQQVENLLHTVREKHSLEKTMLVGCSKCPLAIEALFYMEKGKEECVEAFKETIRASFPSVHIKSMTIPDPTWEIYFAKLSPTLINYREIENRRLYKELQAQGDDENIVRPITHYLLFKSEEGLESFLHSLEKENFTVVTKGLWQGEEKGKKIEYPYHLQLMRADRTTLLDLCMANLPLIPLLISNDGIYHTFTTNIVKKDPVTK